MAINPDATLIPDQAEVWLALKSDVTDISTMIPTSADDNLATLDWEFCGLIDDQKGITLSPSIEVTEYDAFGHPAFRVKLKKGKLKSGFTVFEDNAVTKKFVFPGSGTNKVGRPDDVQVYVLYRFTDDSTTKAWVSLRAAPIEVKDHGGIVDGELSYADCVIHHVANAAGDVFQSVLVV